MTTATTTSAYTKDQLELLDFITRWNLANPTKTQIPTDLDGWADEGIYSIDNFKGEFEDAEDSDDRNSYYHQFCITSASQLSGYRKEQDAELKNIWNKIQMSYN